MLEEFLISLKLIFISIIQGIAEVLPISSSAHVFIVQEALNLSDLLGNSMLLMVLLHFGSLVAVIIYYRKNIWSILKSTCRYLFKKDREEETKENSKIFLYLVIATIPAAIAGVIYSALELDNYLLNLYVVFSLLIVTGIILFTSKFIVGKKSIKEAKWYNALFIGCFQVIGVLPGISRSGITIYGGKVNKINDEDSANFAFLMFVPITLGSFLFECFSLTKKAVLNEPIMMATSGSVIGLVLGVIIAGFVTYLSLKYLLKFIKKGKLYWFSIYCVLVGIIGLICCFSLGYTI